MKDTVIAVPSEAPGGLDALRSGHFGRCDAFTLVAVKAGQVVDSRVVPNGEHQEGGCLVPVELLFREGATSLVVGGIGARPLQGFLDRGIEVLIGAGDRVRDVVDAYTTGALRPITGGDVCGAHHHG
ncbi:MAG: NifB/NifX family molybdenum-iron cluster-binding protein [Deltaproteobacteria bacterium]|nr:NifB/NifX family molybdenum-iron cluster-binding protein [Deltaproteobacteria bacterium]